MRAAEAARWKEQLAKAHAEAEAARKRGAELGEPYKAALEQNKQISAEMRALPHTQQQRSAAADSVVAPSDGG